MKFAQTRSIAIAAPPSAVIEVIGDGNRLPEWAPAFARSARAEEDCWLIDTGGTEVRIRLKTSVESGTVDILSAEDERIGAFGRVIPNTKGSEFLFTLLFEEGTDQGTVDAQMKTVEEELETVRRLSET